MTKGSKVKGLPGSPSAPGDVANIERLQRVLDEHLVTDPGARLGSGDSGVQGVEKFHERNSRGALLTRVFVGSRVRDHQLVGGRTYRVEQKLAVFGSDVTLAGHRLAGQHVVAVRGSESREHGVVEAHEAHDPVRD